jgi:Protein of unknown function (DUF1997)
MQSSSFPHNNITLGDRANISTADWENEAPVKFQTAFAGRMEMYSDGETVANYLNVHQDWFCRCAQPMTVEPLDDRGYTLTIGRFGSKGYEIEPKIAVVLEPPKGRVYEMYTVPVPDYNPVGYDVDYQAVMELLEVSADEVAGLEKIYQKHYQNKQQVIPKTITQVNWRLNMTIFVDLPKFVRKLPMSLIKSTGDALITQIVKQVSPRLTYKVQQDFHTRQSLPLPPKNNAICQKV